MFTDLLFQVLCLNTVSPVRGKLFRQDDFLSDYYEERLNVPSDIRGKSAIITFFLLFSSVNLAFDSL